MDPLLAPTPPTPPTPPGHAPTVVGISFERWRRHPLTTLMSVLVIAAAMALPLTLFSLNQDLYRASQYVDDALDFTVFLEPSLSSTAAQALAQQLGQRADVVSVTYVSKEQGLAEFKSWSNLTTALANLPENPLPASVVVRPKLQPMASLLALVQAIKAQKGVQKVRFDERWSARFLSLRESLGVLCTWLIGMAVAVAVVVTGTLLHLDLRSRYYALLNRVPTSNRLLWLRKIAIFEGLWLALLGALLSIAATQALLLACQPWVSQFAHTYHSEFMLSLPDPSACGVALLLSLVLGLFAGSISSRA